MGRAPGVRGRSHAYVISLIVPLVPFVLVPFVLVPFVLVAFVALVVYWVRGRGIMGSPAASSPHTLRTLPAAERRDIPAEAQVELDSIAEALRREHQRLVSIPEQVSHKHAEYASGWTVREAPLTASERVLEAADDSIRAAIDRISSTDVRLPRPRDSWY